MIVTDASAILELLLQTGSASAIESRLFEAGESLHAPELLDLEIAQVLRRYASRAQLTESRARASLRVLQGIPIERHGHAQLMPRVWALRENLTAYDAAYVALAEGLGATLITCDARLSRAAGVRAKVEVFA